MSRWSALPPERRRTVERDRVAEQLRSGEVGFDPLPDLQRLHIPELWLYGDADENTPVPESVAILDRLKAEGHDVTVKVYPGVGHGLLDTPPSTPDAGPELVSWVLMHATT